MLIIIYCLNEYLLFYCFSQPQFSPIFVIDGTLNLKKVVILVLFAQTNNKNYKLVTQTTICILFQLVFNVVCKPQLGWGLLPSDLYRVPYLGFRFICRSKGREICDFGLKGARRANRCILWPKPGRLQNLVIYSHLQDHCSPSQAVTNKIYHLKQRFLPTATT